MKRALSILAVGLVWLVVFGCGWKVREREHGPTPETVETPSGTDEDHLDIDTGAGTEGGETTAVEATGVEARGDEATADEATGVEATGEEPPLPMDTEFLEWSVAVDEAPQPGRIGDALSRALTFKLNNTLERLLTGRILIDAPAGVHVVPGRTIGWRLRGGRSAQMPAQVTIVEGAPLGRVTLPVTITVLGQEYRHARLELYKWLDERVIGPFQDGPDKSYPPEAEVDFARGCEWEGSQYAWRPLPIEALQPDGMVDFRKVFGEESSGCAYSALHVYAEAATGVVLALTCDSPSTVWLNGRQVLSAAEPLDEAQAIEVTLEKGRSTLLVKCCSAETGWAFVLSVLGKQGDLPASVTFDLVLRQVLADGTTPPDE